MDALQTLSLVNNDQAERLDKFLARHIEGTSRTLIQQWIKESRVHVEGEGAITQANFILPLQASVTVYVPPPRATTLEAAPHISVEVIYQDEHLLVVNKPVGLTVHPGAGNYQDTLANALIAHWQDTLSQCGGTMRPGIVHRLDKGTSGLLIVAKHDEAHRRLSEQLKDRLIERRYFALVYGNVSAKQGTINAALARSRSDRTKMTIVKQGGKSAVTHYRRLARFDTGKAKFSFVECKLETGRTHQIRVHLDSIGHSLVGDDTYRRTTAFLGHLEPTLQQALKQFNHQALHAAKLNFTHPFTQKALTFTAPLPDDFQQLITLLEPYREEC